MKISILILSLTFHLSVFANEAPCKFEIEITGVNVKCNGDSTGIANISIIQVGGDSGPYTIRWFDGDNRSTRDDLPEGTHFVKVTDALGCFVNEFITITEPAPLAITLSKENVKCFGEASGKIDLEVSGGVKNYKYSWSNGESTQDVGILTAGSYHVIVTDLNSCKIDTAVMITQPDRLDVNSTIVPASCPQSSDGQIKTVAFGGVLPYHYQWNTGDTIPNLTDLASSNYTFSVTDGNGCTTPKSYYVPQPPPISFNFEIQDLSCYEKADGRILATVFGGTPGYRYKWSNTDFVLGDTTNNPINLTSDYYKLEVTDANGCVKSDSAFVNQPSPLVLNLEPQPASCFNKPDGAIDLSMSGGNLPYAALWSNGSKEYDQTGLYSGTYSVVVTDKTGCTQYGEIFIGQPDSLDFHIEVTNVSCKDQVDGEISIDPTGGTPVYYVQWSNGAEDFTIKELPGATYDLTLVDDHQCIYEASVTVPVDPIDCITKLTIPTAFTPNGDNYNDNWVIRNYEVYPNMKIEVYNKWGKSVFSSTGYHSPWDGRVNSAEATAGTYYYIVDLNNGDPPFNGSVTIVK